MGFRYNSKNLDENQLKLLDAKIARSTIKAATKLWLTYDFSDEEEMSNDNARQNSNANNNNSFTGHSSAHFNDSQRRNLNPTYVPGTLCYYSPVSQIPFYNVSQAENNTNQGTALTQPPTPMPYQFSYNSQNN